jgi:molecular chaperone GrpE
LTENTNPKDNVNNKTKDREGEQKPLDNNQKNQQNGAGVSEISPETKIKELTETLQRLQAEFENFQKRTYKQNEEYKTYANAKLIEEILPVLDALEQGLTHNKELVLIYEQLFGVLKKNGLKKIPAERGMKFDHNLMECLMQEKDEKLKDGAVVKVLISGYLLNGKILRPSKVSVNETNCEKESNGELNKVEYEIHKMEE